MPARAIENRLEGWRPRSGTVARAARLAIAATLAFLSGGCATSKKYRMVKDPDPPQASLEWTMEAGSALVAVEQVIVFKGPGSWKREAKWDEYVVRLENCGEAALAIERVELLDLHGEPQAPGGDPWELERRSTTNWQRYRSLGLKLLAGAGIVVIYGLAASAVALGSFLGGAGAAGVGAAFNAVPVVLVVNVAVVMGLNESNRTKVESEFSRRRIELPREIAPRSEVRGSWFFPMTPAPQALRVHARRGQDPLVIVLPLPRLSQLHLAPSKPPPAGSAKPPGG